MDTQHMNEAETYIDDVYLEYIGMAGKKYKKFEINCEICDRDDFETILSKGKIGGPGEYGPINVRQCKFCGHVMQSPRYEAQFYKDYYRNVYANYVDSALGAEEPDEIMVEEHTARGKRVYDYISNKYAMSGSVLDLGCAYGYMLIPFRDAGWEIHGIDPEESCVKFGNDKLKLPIDYGFAEDLPYPDHSIDLAVSLGALEHVHDFHASMSELNRVIKPGGHLFIRMRHNRPWGLVWEYYNRSHYRYFCGRTHKLAMIRYGFDVLEYTDEQIEGRTGDRYLVCERTGEPDLEQVDRAVKQGLKDTPEELKAYVESQIQTFTHRSRLLLDIERKCGGNLDKILKEIDNGAVEVPMIFGDRKLRLKRALLEARRMLDEVNGEG